MKKHLILDELHLVHFANDTQKQDRKYYIKQKIIMKKLHNNFQGKVTKPISNTSHVTNKNTQGIF